MKQFKKREKFFFLRLSTSGMRKHAVLDEVTKFLEQYFYQTTRCHVQDEDNGQVTAVRTLNLTRIFMFMKSEIIIGMIC